METGWLSAPPSTCTYRPSDRCQTWMLTPGQRDLGAGEPLGRRPRQGPAGTGLHTENRVSCGASNPYLVGAAAIAAALDGIRNRIEPPPLTEGLAYGIEGPTPIPTRLEAALDALEKDTVLCGLLGEELIRLFLAIKRHEIAKATEHARDYTAEDWVDRVDDFEVAEFFEFL